MDESQPNLLVKSPVADPVAQAPKPAAKAVPTAPAAAKRRGAPTEEKPQPNKMRRRLIWTAVWAYLAANFVMFLRFFFPRALFEPSTVHTIGYPSDYSLGVDERFKQAYRLWVVKEPDRLFVIFARCVHLGCTPDWKPAENKFKCPCHGSGYTPEGINFEGPAPRPMDRCHVELDATGQIVADSSRLFLWDRSKGGRDTFNDPGAFIPL
jgi:cytochrome b6-f complex iron-sulfur subunit